MSEAAGTARTSDGAAAAATDAIVIAVVLAGYRRAPEYRYPTRPTTLSAGRHFP